MWKQMIIILFAVLFVIPSGPVRAAEQADISLFYKELAPYGDWVTIEPYGWAWCPAATAPGWRPYSNGYWTYTDFGWTWVSDAEWGWATDHYGRWFYDDSYGWAWVPDVVWAPAWVAWRYGNGYVGWAALPPDVLWVEERGLDWGTLNFNVDLRWFAWNFTEEQWICKPDLTKHIYSPEHGIAFIKETRNITDYEFVGEHIMNFGLDVGELEQRTHQKMSRLEIVEPPSPDKKHPTRVEGNQLVLFHPHLSESTMETSPPHWERRKPFDADEYRQKLREYHTNQIKSLKELQDDLLRNPPPGFSKGELEEQNQLDMDDVMEHQRRETQVLENWIKEEQKLKQKPEETGKAGGEKK